MKSTGSTGPSKDSKTTPAKASKKPSALQQPVQPDTALAAVVGEKAQPRSEITKKLWDYIKKNDLQDPANRRNIRADANLKKVFGGKEEVDMFEMTRLVNQHIQKA